MSGWGEIALKNALNNDQITIIGDSKPQKRQDLSKLLPEGSKHEVKFMRLWSELQGPQLEREVKFDSKRKWRADFGYITDKVKLLIEIEGFGHQKSRYAGDVEKYNAVSLQGFKLCRLTPDMINVIELQKIIDYIKEATK